VLLKKRAKKHFFAEKDRSKVWASGLIAQSGAIAFKKSHTIKLAQRIVGRTYEPPLRSLSIAALTFPPVCSSAAAASSVFVKPIPAICSSCGA